MKNTGNQLLARVARAIDGLTEFTGYLCGIFVLVAGLVNSEGVFAREVLNKSTTWQGEFSVYLLMAAAVIGAAYTQKHEGHIGVDLLTSRLADRTRRFIDIAGKMLGFIVAVVIAILAWDMWWIAIKDNEHSETLWGPHLGFPYFIIPFGMSLLALQYLVRIGFKIASFRTRNTPQLTPSAPLGTSCKEAAQ